MSSQQHSAPGPSPLPAPPAPRPRPLRPRLEVLEDRLTPADLFQTSVWSDLGTNTGWSARLVGDFDNDGRQDDVAQAHSSGSWWVGLGDSATRQFATTRWARMAPASGYAAHLAGDFDSDGFVDDIASFHSTRGTWQVSLGNAAARTFTTRPWATFGTKTGWTQLVGDFDRDGVRDDIVNYHTSGAVFVCTPNATRTAFDSARWGTLPGGTANRLVVGTFRGPGVKDDLALFHPATGRWLVTSPDPATRTFAAPTTFATFATRSGWSSQLVGDFNRDGLDDVAQYRASDRTWWVSRSDGLRFHSRPWATLPAGTWTRHLVGNFNADGFGTLVSFNAADATLHVGSSNGGQFQFDVWAQLPRRNGWTAFVVGDFDGPDPDIFGTRPTPDDNVAAFNSTDGTWHVGLDASVFSSPPFFNVPNGGSASSTRTVSGLTGPILDLNVRLGMQPTNSGAAFLSDLVVTLTRPGVGSVELFRGVFGTITGFVGFTLDDEAAAAIAGYPPWESTHARLTPTGTLSDFDGQDPNGAWRLEVTDLRGDSPSSWTITDWSLIIKTRAF